MPDPGPLASLAGVARSVHPADVADVVLLAAVLFVAISWVRRTSSSSAARRVWLAGLVYALLYALVDRLGLYLVTELLRGLLLVLVIALVLVYQTDIRRSLDRLLSWKPIHGRPPAVAGSPAQVLSAAVGRLAKTRTGALIAIRGDDPWGTQVSGGVELDGRISDPLLQSIFDPSSDGHDGAMLIEGDRITRFGVHLPLAATPPAVSHAGGTRHAAALGLAEVRDAFVIVVSEERGVVSVARDGRLRQLPSPAELEPLVEAFWSQHYRRPPVRGRGQVARTLTSALWALLIACGLWVAFAYSGSTIERSYKVPVDFRNLPAGWILDSDSVPDVILTVAASERDMTELRPTSLTATLDLPNPHPGMNRIPITDASVRLPPGVQLVASDPPFVAVVAERVAPTTVAIHVPLTAPLPDSLALEVDPPRLTVLAAPSDSLPPTASTAPIDPATLLSGEAQTLDVLLPAGAQLASGEPAQVTVRAVPRPAPRPRGAAPAFPRP